MTSDDILATLEAQAAGLMDGRPATIRFRGIPADAAYLCGQATACAVAAFRETMPGRFVVTWRVEGDTLIATIRPAKEPPPDALFRWGWRERAGAWVRRWLGR